MNRKKIGLFAFLAAVAGCSLFAQVTIDAAISSAARDFSQRVPRGARVAVLNIASEHATLTDYIINELIFHMVREGALSVVSRGEVEMQAGLMELQFQMTDFVSTEDQRRLGEFLAVHTFITGSVIREGADSYRLVLNAVHLETFVFQAVYGTSVRIDDQMRVLIGLPPIFIADFSTGERIRMGMLNMIFGAGSIINGQRLGWGLAAGQAAGWALLGVAFFVMDVPPYEMQSGYWDNINMRWVDTTDWAARNAWYEAADRALAVAIAGVAALGASILAGYIIPFFHTRPGVTNTNVATLPVDIRLASGNGRTIDGVSLTRSIRF